MITALDVRRALAQRDRTSALSPLDELPAPARDAIIAAMEGMPDDASVDLGRLIHRAREKVADAEAAEWATAPARCRRYATLLQLNTGQLDELDRAMEAGTPYDEALALVAQGSGHTPARMEPPQEPRRTVARYRGAASGLRPRRRRLKD